MRIKSFTIKNYRSIKALKVDNLNPVNVFFGKNNVGKSNILRALHLVFYSLKNDEIYLPDTVFHNRNIYKPVEIAVDLILEEDFYDTEKVDNALREGIENIRSVDVDKEDLFRDIMKEVEEFIEESGSFKPVEKFRLKTHLGSDEETSEIGFSIEDLESDYRFDYGKYKILYGKLKSVIQKKIGNETKRITEVISSRLIRLGVDPEEMLHLRYAARSPYGDQLTRLRHLINGYVKDHREREEILYLLDQYSARVQEPKNEIIKPISKVFNIVEEYFEKISDNFILIPNKEYLLKGPFDEKDGEQIKIFDVNRFKGKLASLIESPTKKERELIQKFNSVFGSSYGDLGELEIRKFREEVLAIFDTGFTALPIENQGLGVQDLFLYLAHIILFDSAIIAIEEPEGGLSTENQRILHNIIEDVYSGSDKQIFISSHSEEFETPNSYVIEVGKEGTKEVSRMEEEKEYETKIEGILIKRKLAEEKEQYEALLKEVTERQMALDILNYIDSLDDKEKLDPKKISNELGYKKEKVEQVLREITKRRA